MKKWGISDLVTVVKANTEEDVREYVKTKWSEVPDQSLFVSSNAEAPFTKLQTSGWTTIYSGPQYITMLQNLKFPSYKAFPF